MKLIQNIDDNYPLPNDFLCDLINTPTFQNADF